jgi:hypothetical protein
VCKLLCDPDVVDSEVTYFMQRFDHDGDGVVTLDEVSLGLPAARSHLSSGLGCIETSSYALSGVLNNTSRSKTCLKP